MLVIFLTTLFELPKLAKVLHSVQAHVCVHFFQKYNFRFELLMGCEDLLLEAFCKVLGLVLQLF